MSKKRVKILDMFTTPSSILGMSPHYGKPGKKSKPAPQGSHYMPDGNLMKDSAHKGKSSGAPRKPSSAALDAMMRKIAGSK